MANPGSQHKPHRSRGALEADAAHRRTLELAAALQQFLQQPVQDLTRVLADHIRNTESRLRRRDRMQRHVNLLTFKAARMNRWFISGGMLMCFAFLGIVIWMLQDQRETLLPVITALIGLLAGAGGGWLFSQKPTVPRDLP